MHADLAEQVAKVPQLYGTGNKSTATILIEAGFPEARQHLSISELEKAFRHTPQLTELWLKRANDQRMVGGWGIEKEAEEYRVQDYSTGKGFLVSDRFKACAEFVARYVSFIGDALAKSH